MRLLTGLIFSLLLVSCSSYSNQEQNRKYNPREYQLAAYLWQQTSGEYKALSYQAYSLAKEKILRDLENKHNKKRAVIFDVDETVLDNSYGGAREVKEGIPWNENLFAEWVKLKQAVAIPGALEFVKYLEERQVEIFYITNRKSFMLEDTYENLVSQGFPVKKKNLLMMGTDHSKESRRKEVEARHEVVLLIGDNLTDFHASFDQTTSAERNNLVDQMKSEFGKKYIILPNPLYGDWERSLPRGKSKYDNLKLKPSP